ncbi:MAG: HPF/RaiA family ribosome-associated protein [Planctomycetaceae bacterium]
MDFFIHAKGLHVSSDTRETVNDRLDVALHRFSDEVAKVHTTLENVNGPKGGRDKRCVLNVTLTHHGAPLVCSARHMQLEGAVSQAARRLTRMLAARSDKFVARQHAPQVSALAD